MSQEMESTYSKTNHYLITVEGKIDPSWSEWLGYLQIISKKEANGQILTTISGRLIDQADLRGLLNRLWDLNLVLRSVQRIDAASTSDKE